MQPNRFQFEEIGPGFLTNIGSWISDSGQALSFRGPRRIFEQISWRVETKCQTQCRRETIRGCKSMVARAALDWRNVVAGWVAVSPEKYFKKGFYWATSSQEWRPINDNHSVGGTLYGSRFKWPMVAALDGRNVEGRQGGRNTARKRMFSREFN